MVLASRLEVESWETESPKELGLVQVQDTDATQAWVDQAFAANEQAVRDALDNPKKTKAAIGFLRRLTLTPFGVDWSMSAAWIASCSQVPLKSINRNNERPKGVTRWLSIYSRLLIRRQARKV